MALSSNSIIHFTNSAESLKGILENDFSLSYCRESINLKENLREYFIPMVSFCDIPLSQIKYHIEKYGSYGIGLTKEWAVKNGLNPVLYIEKKSMLSSSYDFLFDKFVMQSNSVDLEDMSEEEKSIIDVLRYMKNYQGRLKRKNSTIPDYRFSDEREWRYVPPYSAKVDSILHPNFADEHTNSIEFKKSKTKLSKISLKFEPNDIKYIIIKDESEIHYFLDILRKSKGNKYTYNDVERLTTRILTTEQINSDI